MVPPLALLDLDRFGVPWLDRFGVTWSFIYVFGGWLVRAAMVVYVPQRRSPAAARAWLLMILAFPWIGLLLYMLLGRPYFTSRRIDRQKKISGLLRGSGDRFYGPHVSRPELPSNFDGVAELAAHLGDFPILGGNRLDLLAGYDGVIDRLVGDIDEAREHVHLLYYIFADDATGRRVADALARAAARGVSCRVLMDGLGSKAWRNKIKDAMRGAGVEVVTLLPVRLFRRGRPRLDLRNHRKIAVIDGRVGYVGSQNIVDAQLKPGIVYEELVARVTGPVVMELQAVFLADRSFEGAFDGRWSDAFPEHPEPQGGLCAQVLPSGPGYPQQNTRRILVNLLYAAQKRVVITTPYFIPDEPLLEALAAAVQRGVEVHLIVSRKSDQRLVGWAQQSYYEELLESGVRIHRYQRRFLHAKHVSVDDAVAVVGSSNMDIRSFLLNAEISLIAYGPNAAAALHEVHEWYLSGADELTAERWRRRGAVQKVVQNTARLFDSVL